MNNKRDRLIEQAAVLFDSKGVISVTMDDLASYTGLSKKPYTSILPIKRSLSKP